MPIQEYQSEQRKKRIKYLDLSIQNATRERGCASKIKILAVMGIDFGLRKEVINEYLTLLEDAGFIKISGDEITHLHPNDDYQDKKD